MFGLGAFALLSNAFTSALNSMASSSFNLVHMDSTTVMYSTLGILMGANGKLGPFAKTDLCT